MMKIKEIIGTLRIFYSLRMGSTRADEAAERAGRLYGRVSARTVFRWNELFIKDKGKLWVPRRGKYKRKNLLDDKDVKQRCYNFFVKNSDPL